MKLLCRLQPSLVNNLGASAPGRIRNLMSSMELIQRLDLARRSPIISRP